MITGIRGLCNGLGPALYGFIFYIFHVELNELPMPESPSGGSVVTQYHLQQVFCFYLLIKKKKRNQEGIMSPPVLEYDAVLHFITLTANEACKKRF